LFETFGKQCFFTCSCDDDRSIICLRTRVDSEMVLTKNSGFACRFSLIQLCTQKDDWDLFRLLSFPQGCQFCHQLIQSPIRYICVSGHWPEVPVAQLLLTLINLKQVLANLFCKGLESRYLWFSQSYGLHYNSSTLLLCGTKAATDNM
jgi:hypothetical protein